MNNSATAPHTIPPTIPPNRVSISHGDITRFKGGAIVNAANSTLMGGGGVDGAIHSAGGATILEECKAVRKTYPQGLPVGEVATTGAGRLGVDYIIHTVAPVWRGGTNNEAALLAACYRNTLAEMVRLNIERAAYPAIGTGVYRFPKQKAATIALDTIAAHCQRHSYPTHIEYILFSQADFNIVYEYFKQIC